MEQMLILEKEALSFAGEAVWVCGQCVLRVLELIAVEFDTRPRNRKTAANAQHANCPVQTTVPPLSFKLLRGEIVPRSRCPPP